MNETVLLLQPDQTLDTERGKRFSHWDRCEVRHFAANVGGGRSTRNGLASQFSIWFLSICLLPSLVLGQSRRDLIPHSLEQRCASEIILPIPVDVPMRVYRGLPIVEVWIEGDGPYSFAIDTGAMHPVIIDSSLAERLGSILPKNRQDGEATGRPPESGKLAIDSMQIGEAVFRGLPAKLGGFRKLRLPIDGILGLCLFEELLLTLDYPGERVRIEQAELSDTNEANILPIEGHPTGLDFVELGVDGDTLLALVDTGNLAGAFYLPRALATRLRWVSQTASARKARTAGGEIVIEEVQLAGTIHLGPLAFDRPVVVFGDVLSRAIIGGQALGEHVVSIDQKNRRLRLER